MPNPGRSGAQVILDVLKEGGTDCIFASPIAAMAPFWEVLAARRERAEPESPKYYQVRHEMLAVALASGYFKASGRSQAVFLPTGLGVLHGAMALRTAHQEHTPMTVLSPDALTFGAVPELDPGPEWPSLLVDTANPARHGELFVKWSKEVKAPTELASELRRALYFAESIPKGPTLVSVPFDVMMSPAPHQPQPRLAPRPVMAAPEQLDEVAALLARSEMPIILTEHAGRTESESAALVGLAEALSAPIFEFLMPAYHNAPRTHPLVMQGFIDPILPQADVILVAGSSAPWHPPNFALRPGAVVIQLEEDPLRPRSVFWGYQTTHAVAGERELNLRGLAERVKRQLPSPPAQRLQHWQKYKAEAMAQGMKMGEAAYAEAMAQGRIPTVEVFMALARALPASSSIVDELLAQIFQLPVLFMGKPFRQYRGYFGALGTGLGTALGVKLARPGDTVVCLIGDGALHYNPVPAAFGFAQQYGAPILIVVCDNAGYMSQRWSTFKYFGAGSAVRTGTFYGSDLTPTPDYPKLIEAYGGKGERVERMADLEPAIARALATLAEGKSALLDVALSP
jgi:acetolactate synthase-1/2/3 large subunit